MADQTTEIIYEKSDGIARVTLNRPPANSYYKDFLLRLKALIDEIENDDKVKAVLIASRSEKFFCAGADIKIFASNSVSENEEMVKAARSMTEAITLSKNIYVVAISGHILGGGLELAMACDIRLASKGNYLIGLPEVKLGLMPGNGGTARLIDLIGAGRAKELLITGDSVSPQKAYDFGLFNQLYETSEFNISVDAYVKALSKGAGEAMAKVKSYVHHHKGMTEKEALTFEAKCVEKLYDTSDAKEGFQAFVEKREPNYK